jgi:putative transposase
LRPHQKYAIFKSLAMDIGILCSLTEVSRSGYYRWLATSYKEDKDYGDFLLIKKIFESGKRKYGWRTIQMKLPGGRYMNHKKIKRIMKKHGLVCRIRRKNPYKQMAKATQEHRTFDNRLDRGFAVDLPFAVFCTDITYLPFNRRLAYLSVIKDIGTGEVVAWKLSLHIDMELVLGTVERLRTNAAIPADAFPKIMIHSDQGFHYTNPRYIEQVNKLNMTQSMSRRGNCIDNAPMESFFGHFKDDVEYETCRTFEELHGLVEDYMRYYNHERCQWELKKMTPVEYRNHLLCAD